MTAAMLVQEPIFEAGLPPELYAYRPGRNAHRAVVEVDDVLFRRHPEVVDAAPVGQGDADAQMSLGSMYANGRGVPQDDITTHMWFDLAASRAGDATVRQMAVRNRDEAAAKMTPAQIAEAQRMAREWKPTQLLGR